MKGLRPHLPMWSPIASERGSRARCEQEAARVPKKEIQSVPSIPSVRAVSWHARFSPGRKSSIVGSILVRSGLRLAGSAAIFVLYGLVFPLYFTSYIYVVTPFEQANKMMII